MDARARVRLQAWLDAGVQPNSFAAHAPGRSATHAVERAREAVATLVPWARPADVVFTSGATEANALALASAHAVCAPCEHPSVLTWCDASLPLAPTGRLDLAALAATTAPVGCTRVSVQLANGETGVLQPLADVARWARTRGYDVHVDASQAPGRVDLTALEHADLVTFSAHKMGGPQGVGALVVRGGAERATPRQRGGPHERGARAGTHPVALIDAFGAAAAASAERHAGMPAVARLRADLEAGILERGGVRVGDGPRLPNTLMVTWDGLDPADLVMALDLEGVCVSAGAACASGSHRASEGLRAMGFPAGGVRWSLGPETRAEDIAGALAALDRVLARVA